MIPGAFAYHRPTSVKEAISLLAQFGEEGRALAGGHSLIPMMKLRLATPEHLVDLAGVAELKGIRVDGGDIIIGAMTMSPASASMPLSSAPPARSTRCSGVASRSFIIGIRLCPPASARPSSPNWASRLMASLTDVGR